MRRLPSRRESHGKNVFSYILKKLEMSSLCLRRLEAFEGIQGRAVAGVVRFLRLGCVHGHHAGFLSSPPKKHAKKPRSSETCFHTQPSKLRRRTAKPVINASSARAPPRAYYRQQQRLLTKRRADPVIQVRFAPRRASLLSFQQSRRGRQFLLASLATLPSTATRCLRDLYMKCTHRGASPPHVVTR